MNLVEIGVIELNNNGELQLMRLERVREKVETALTNIGETMEGSITISAKWLIEELMVLRACNYPDLLIHQIILAPFDFFNHKLTKLSKNLFGNQNVYADPVVINLPNGALGYIHPHRVTQSNTLNNTSFTDKNGKTTNLTLKSESKTDNKGNWQINLPCALNFINGVVIARIELEDWNDLINNIFLAKPNRNKTRRIKTRTHVSKRI